MKVAIRRLRVTIMSYGQKYVAGCNVANGVVATLRAENLRPGSVLSRAHCPALTYKNVQ